MQSGVSQFGGTYQRRKTEHIQAQTYSKYRHAYARQCNRYKFLRC